MVPSAGVTQMLLPLKNIHEQYQITRIVVSDYTSTSVYGKEGMDELFNQTRKIFMNDTLVDDQQVFHKQVAFNVIPPVSYTHLAWFGRRYSLRRRCRHGYAGRCSRSGS